MYTIEIDNKFKKEYKLAIKRGLKIELLNDIILLLEKEGKIPDIFRPHKLKGEYLGLWECHIQSDWLLIWNQNETIRLITLVRTGTHSDLFK